MNAYLTELIGTFFLTLTVATAGHSDLAPLAVGAVLMVMIYAGGYISGAHYNPAVSIAVLFTRNFPKHKIRGYFLAQLIGSLAALFIARGLTGEAFVPSPASTVMFAPLITEILCTFALIYVILHVACSKETKGNQYYGLAIGATLLLCAIIGGWISGAVLNPAIGIASYLVNIVMKTPVHFTDMLLYVVGPVTGAVLAAMVYGIQKRND